MYIRCSIVAVNIRGHMSVTGANRCKHAVNINTFWRRQAREVYLPPGGDHPPTKQTALALPLFVHSGVIA